MKNTQTKLALIFAAGILTLFACKKETQTLNPVITPSPTLPSSSQLANLFADYQEDLVQGFVIDAASPVLITGTKGTTIQFNANSFETLSGGVVTGNVDINLIEIFDKSDMILANVPTVGRDYTGNLQQLISGGEFRVTASQNGTPLKLKQYNNYQVNVPAPNGVDPQMQLFYGEQSLGNDTLVWNPADSARIQGSGNSYYCFFDSLQWINCDYFYSNPNPKTNVRAQLPSGFTNQTCKVFISFNGLNSITAFYNYSAGVYSTGPSYQLPTTLGINLVAIAMINNVPYMSITPATITNNIFIPVNPLTATTNAAMATAINNLP